MSVDPADDQSVNPSNNESFRDILDARLSRRSVLGGSVATVAAAVAAGTILGGAETIADAVPAAAAPAQTGPLVTFQSVAVSAADTVVVPPGYTATPLIKWGDPISTGPAFKPDASNTAAEQAQQWGMNNDGLVYFPAARPVLDIPVLRSLFGPVVSGLFGSLFRTSERGIICQNHEYVDEGLLFPDGIANYTVEKANKVLAAHGVSVIEVEKKGKTWKVVRPSKLARRITGNTPMKLVGPAAGDPRLRTADDPTGTKVLGTINNCAMGYTPWGTYLTCEENFNGYFIRSQSNLTPLEQRYGIAPFGQGVRLGTQLPRFNADVTPNEPNRFGWVVEIDPFSPKSTPVKHTGLGRLKHEGAWVQEAKDGRVVVYMGDDQVNEYIYRYVSRQPWKKAFKHGKHPLDDGTIFVGKFKADGTGEWLPLTPDNPALAGWSLADILINTRGAADAAGGTKMDRPEWIDTIPKTLEVLCTLTNNSGRGTGGSNPAVDAANPRSNNRYGQIIRWKYAYDFTEPTFTWDLFALAGDPTATANTVPAQTNPPSNINGDKYGSPDGLYVAPSGRIWIQTDVSTSTINTGAFYSGFGNNQMLCADPVTKETRRFLVGPKQCEVTGVFATPDERTLFVGIQHPGEPASEISDPANPSGVSSWPDGPGNRPRSSLLVITKDDGGVIGS